MDLWVILGFAHGTRVSEERRYGSLALAGEDKASGRSRIVIRKKCETFKITKRDSTCFIIVYSGKTRHEEGLFFLCHVDRKPNIFLSLL